MLIATISGPVRPYFETHGAAGAVFWATSALWILGEIRPGQRQRSDATEADQGSRQLLRITIASGWFVAFLAIRQEPTARIIHGREGAFWVGMALMWAGVGLRFWAFRVLGRYFTFTVMTSTDQAVVTKGPYRMLRHPGYAGGALALAGLGLAMGNWVSLWALVVLPLIGTVNRIRVEEAALGKALGAEYAAFAAGRKRMVPFVW